MEKGKSRVGDKEAETIDRLVASAAVMSIDGRHTVDGDLIGEECNELSSLQASLDRSILLYNMNSRLDYSKFAMAVGSMNACDSARDEFFMSNAVHAEAPKGVDSKTLSKIWSIDENLAKETLKVTSQLRKTDGESKLSRNVSTNDRMLRYKRLSTHFFSDTFFVTKKAKSTRGNTCMQMYISDKGFVFVVPMKSKGEFIHSLKLFAKEIGVLEALVVDPSGEQTSTKVKLFCQSIGTTLRRLEEGTQWANRAELYIGLFKESVRKDLRESNSPLVLWDYASERRTRIHNLTPRNLFQLQGQNPHMATLGEEGDISNVCTFGWYEWCYFRNHSS